MSDVIDYLVAIFGALMNTLRLWPRDGPRLKEKGHD